MNTATKETTAHLLLEVGAVRIQPQQPFTWASGWKSPIYCDNRLTLSFPEARTTLKTALSTLIQQQFATAEGVAGVATAGIPQGALVADALNLPFMYVRAKPKAHGMTNLIEGRMKPGSKVVVLEDLVSTGGSSLSAVEALRQANYEVLGLVAIFTYGFPQATANFEQAGVPFVALSDYSTLLNIALQQGIISDDEKQQLATWRTSPETWGI